MASLSVNNECSYAMELTHYNVTNNQGIKFAA